MSTNFDQKVTRLIGEWQKVENRQQELQDKNQALIRGTVEDKARQVFMWGKTYYRITVGVERHSTQIDHIPVIMSQEIFDEILVFKGKQIEVEGAYRSRNVYGKDERTHLELFLLANQIAACNENEKFDENVIFLEGCTTKKSQLRITPYKRVITDIMLAVNSRSTDKDDLLKTRTSYIPCIAWGDCARQMDGKPAGTHVILQGRIQSREYVKRYNNPEKEDSIKTAYEVSVMKMILD